jgi:hypothetical protein
MNSRQSSITMNNRTAVIVSIRVILAIFLGTAPFFGCASTSSTPGSSSNQQQVVANFDLSKCTSQGAGLYKCPAIDKPICDSTYSGDVECVKIGKKGSVFVMGPTQTP